MGQCICKGPIYPKEYDIVYTYRSKGIDTKSKVFTLP